LRQQIERDQVMPAPRRIAPEKPANLPVMKSLEGTTVTVKAFRFSGNTLLASDKLSPVVAHYLNRPIGLTELQLATTAIANAYREAGWIVRAYLPKQDITEGVVTVHIVEAVFGGADIKGDIPKQITREQILRIFEAQQKTGQLLNADKLDRALLLADDLPGVTVVGSLSEGAREGETNLELKLGEEPLTLGSVAIDNTGSRSTGSDRLTASLNLNSPYKHGDQIGANVIHTQGSDYLRLDTNFPIGSNGWRVGINGSHLGYRLVAPEFTALNASGTSDSLGLESTFPLIRSRLKNLYLNITADNKTFDNVSSGASTSNYKANALTIGLDGNLFDSLGGGGASSGSVSLVEGNLNLNGSPNQFNPGGSINQTAGHYAKLHYAASRQQTVTDTVSLFGALSGQAARKNLDSSEKFYLGGSTGVRAYPANEGGGSEGQMVNLELRWRLLHGYNLTGFYDYGHITVDPNHTSTTLNEYSLKGAGLSLAWQSSKGASFKGTYAHRIGNNPNPVNGNDQDGTLLKNRFWLTGNLPF
jgi:hemolysin activation/secretion protein